MEFVCSKCHIAGSLKDIQKEYGIQPQFLKREIAHDLITLSNYKKHEDHWKPYLINDVLGLAFLISKHCNAVHKITGVSYKSCLTGASLAWNCLGRYLKDSYKTFRTLRKLIC